MNAIPNLKPADKARAQHAFDGLATAGFDFEAAHPEGWTVAEAEPNTNGTPGVQLQRPFQATRTPGCTWSSAPAPGPSGTGRPSPSSTPASGS